MVERRVLSIGAETFINGPYVECPKCKEKTFGVLSIHERSFLRRCKTCFYPTGTEPSARFALPALRKKIIYLDQMAISNMMKAINPKAHKSGTLDNFWRTMFEKLDILCKLQIVVCPASQSHKHESLPSLFFAALKRMYEHLSGGTTFRGYEEIYRFQAAIQCERWMGAVRSDLAINEIMMGSKVDAWQDRFMITLNIQESEGLLEELLSNRGKIEEGWVDVFKRWQSETDRDFDDWYEEESKDAAPVLVRSYFQQLRKSAEIQSGQRLPNMDDFLPPMAVILFINLIQLIESRGFKDDEARQKLMQFLDSPTFRETPFIQISSLLYAAVARKASRGGQKAPPNRGFNTDVNIVASLFPFCDVMFLDNQMRALLFEKPLSDRLGKYGTKVFSIRTRGQFLEYLDELRESVPDEHLKAVEEVYGPEWVRAYVEMYEG